MNYRDIKMLLLHAEFQLRKFEFEAPSKLVKHTDFPKIILINAKFLFPNIPNSYLIPNYFNKTLLILYIEQ